MNKIGYLIKFAPYIIEENSKGELYHLQFNIVDEFFEDECEFNERVTQLSNGYWEDLDGAIYDGVDIIDLYSCELHRINR